MSKTRVMEVLVGAFMAVGFVALFFLAMQVSNLGTVHTGDSYKVTARFDNIGGLKAKAPVTMAGVEVGRVLEIYYDPDNLEDVRAAIDAELKERIWNDSGFWPF